MEVLLGWEEVTPNRPDNRDHMPLMLAEMRGHKGLIEPPGPHEFADMLGEKLVGV